MLIGDAAALQAAELAIANALAGKGSIQQAATESGAEAGALQRLASDLAAAKPALVLSGVTDENALDVALAVAAINRSAGAVGSTIRPDQPLPRDSYRKPLAVDVYLGLPFTAAQVDSL